MDRIDNESIWLFCPCFADEFVGGKALQGLQAAAVIIGIDEICEVSFELFMAVVVIPFDGRFLDRPVHPFDLTICPWMFDFGEAVLDAVLLAAHIEHVSHVGRCRTVGVARREGKLDAVVCQDGVNLVWNGSDESFQESGCGGPSRFLHQLDEGEFARAIDSNIQIELPFGRLYLCDVDMKIPDRIGLEFLLFRLVARDVRQTGNAVPLQTTMQRRPGEMRDRGLQGIKTVIQREQRVRLKATMTASSSTVRIVDLGSFGPMGTSETAVRLFHLATVFGLIPYRFASALRLS